MLERYFIRPATLDRIRASWVGELVERYVTWLTERGYAARNVYFRVPLLVRFGEFARSEGAAAWEELPEYVEAFVGTWLVEHGKHLVENDARKVSARAIRGPINQMIRVMLPDCGGVGRRPILPAPFLQVCPNFFAYLHDERGLKQTTIVHYKHHLRRFEAYLRQIGLSALSELSPIVLSSFVTDCSRVLGKPSVQSLCCVLKVFLRYLHQEGLISRDLSMCLESPQQFRYADVPRSISWQEVSLVLESIDRRGPVGKRDYAILLLLVTYGLRAREVAALRLDDIDWRSERLRVADRKAGHSTVYPLSATVARAIVDYIQYARPKTAERRLFLCTVAPFVPISWVVVSQRAKHYLRRAGIDVPRPGSHTLRHTCVQRLVDAHLSLKVIGDYVGHRSAAATRVYAKVDTESLRELALGDGEVVL